VSDTGDICHVARGEGCDLPISVISPHRKNFGGSKGQHLQIITVMRPVPVSIFQIGK
jgi:hypothetical protein